ADGPLVKAGLGGLPPLDGVADLPRAGAEVEVGGGHGGGAPRAAEGAADRAGDLEIRRQEGLEQRERHGGDGTVAAPRSVLGPLAIGAKTGLAGGPAEPLETRLGGAGGQPGRTGEPPGAGLPVDEVEAADL